MAKCISGSLSIVHHDVVPNSFQNLTADFHLSLHLTLVSLVTLELLFSFLSCLFLELQVVLSDLGTNRSLLLLLAHEAVLLGCHLLVKHRLHGQSLVFTVVFSVGSDFRCELLIEAFLVSE